MRRRELQWLPRGLTGMNKEGKNPWPNSPQTQDRAAAWLWRIYERRAAMMGPPEYGEATGSNRKNRLERIR